MNQREATESLFHARFWGVVDLIGHALGFHRFDWFGRAVCDRYDEAARRHWNGR